MIKGIALLLLLPACVESTPVGTTTSVVASVETACGPMQRQGKARVYRDAIGREVSFAKTPSRIVSLAPNLTETLFAIGAGASLVGVSAYCDYPAGAKELPSVGGFTNTSPEAVLALRPDLVLATADASSRKRFDAIVRAGQLAFVVLPSDMDSTARMIECLGHLTNRELQAHAVADEMLRRRDAVKKRVGSRKPVRAILLLQARPLIAGGSGTFVDELITTGGGVNVAADAPVAWPRLQREAVVIADPEVIFTTFPGGVQIAKDMLRGTRAVTTGRVYELDPALVERPGPRLITGLELVAGYLHPEPAR